MFIVTYTFALYRWAKEQRPAISSTLFDAAALAPKAGAPIYTASAPANIAVRPIAALRAGDSNSRVRGIIDVVKYFESFVPRCVDTIGMMGVAVDDYRNTGIGKYR